MCVILSGFNYNNKSNIIMVDGQEIEVELEAVFVDENPDLYKQRTIQALNEMRYDDALIEVKLALKYGNEELEYKVLMLRVLFEMGDYSACLEYLKNSGLWEKKDDNSIFVDEQNYIYYVYAYCYRECSKPLNNIGTVIISADGKGMFATIQEAINKVKNLKTIILTEGTYNENEVVLRNVNLEIKSVKRQKVTLSETKFKVYDNSNICISDIIMSSLKLKEDEYIIEVYKKARVCLMYDEFIGRKGYMSGGVLICGGEAEIVQSCIRNDVGVNVDSGKATIRNGIFDGNMFGVVVCSEKNDNPKVYLNDCVLRNIYGENSFGIMVGPHGYAEINKCKICDGHIGVGVMSGDTSDNGVVAKAVIFNSILHCNGKSNITVCEGGEAILHDSTISGSRTYGYVVENAKLTLKNCHLKHNRIEKYVNGRSVVNHEGVTRADNNMVGSSVESGLNVLKKILNF